MMASVPSVAACITPFVGFLARFKQKGGGGHAEKGLEESVGGQKKHQAEGAERNTRAQGHRTRARTTKVTKQSTGHRARPKKRMCKQQARHREHRAGKAHAGGKNGDAKSKPDGARACMNHSGGDAHGGESKPQPRKRIRRSHLAGNHERNGHVGDTKIPLHRKKGGWSEQERDGGERGGSFEGGREGGGKVRRKNGERTEGDLQDIQEGLHGGRNGAQGVEELTWLAGHFFLFLLSPCVL